MPNTSSHWTFLTAGVTSKFVPHMKRTWHCDVGETLQCSLSFSKNEAVYCRLVDEIVWVKMTVNRRMAKSHGYYLQHAKEVCLVGKKGSDPPGTKRCVGSDIIYSERRGQSQKPEEIYQLIEELVPNGESAHLVLVVIVIQHVYTFAPMLQYFRATDQHTAVHLQ